jgi:transposase
LARKWIEENLINNNIVFSDEKRFSFDGPDSWCSWYDPLDPPLRIKRQMNGGAVMVWGMTMSTGEIYVKKLEGKIDSDKYISLLKHHIKPYLNSAFGEGGYFFQQDNCKVHVSNKTLTYLKSAKIKTFEWPSMSPDLNIQENVWKIISDIVYDQKQYTSAESLWKSIETAVAQINSTRKKEIKSIYDKFNTRLLKVIDNKGDAISY